MFLVLGRVADGPSIIRDGSKIRLGEADAALRRHVADVVPGFGYASLDDAHQTSNTAVAPEPLAGNRVGANRRALPVSAMASGAGPSGRVTVEDAVTQCDLIGRAARRNRQRSTGNWVNAFGREEVTGGR
jgi:hypothetical protein